VSGAAITVILQQLKAIFGETKSGSSALDYIGYFFQQLPESQWRTVLIGFSSIALLTSIRELGRRLGKRYRAIWYFSVARTALALVLFTLISWAVNKDLKKPLFAISKVSGGGVLPPSIPDKGLILKVAARSVTLLLAMAMEHLAMGKEFGRRASYEIDGNQELTFVGVINLFGSFFSCMPVTGAFCRTAVNADSGVKSPLGGLVTSAVVLVTIYKLTGAFY
jgi:solute carrier family 26 (sodium-independent sulfate anion transporter), member 11